LATIFFKISTRVVATDTDTGCCGLHQKTTITRIVGYIKFLEYIKN